MAACSAPPGYVTLNSLKDSRMVPAATAILATRSCCVSTGVSYTRHCMYPQRKKSNGVKSGERGGHVIGSRMMALQHTALMSYVSIWMKPLATDGLDVEAQEPGYGLDYRGVGVRVPEGSIILSSPRCPDQHWGPPSFLSSGYRRAVSLGVKLQGHEADQLQENVDLYIHSPIPLHGLVLN
jgi:hypothetical protein